MAVILDFKDQNNSTSCDKSICEKGKLFFASLLFYLSNRWNALCPVRHEPEGRIHSNRSAVGWTLNGYLCAFYWCKRKLCVLLAVMVSQLRKQLFSFYINTYILYINAFIRLQHPQENVITTSIVLYYCYYIIFDCLYSLDPDWKEYCWYLTSSPKQIPPLKYPPFLFLPFPNWNSV